MILASTIFETGVKIATKIRREKNENCVEFSFHSISGFYLMQIPRSEEVARDHRRTDHTKLLAREDLGEC